MNHRPEGFYTSTESLQNLLANMSVPQHSGHSIPPVEFVQSNRMPSPSDSTRASTSQKKDTDNIPQDDRRTSSIATLRLKAREHEKELDKLRYSKQNDDSSN